MFSSVGVCYILPEFRIMLISTKPLVLPAVRRTIVDRARRSTGILRAVGIVRYGAISPELTAGHSISDMLQETRSKPNSIHNDGYNDKTQLAM